MFKHLILVSVWFISVKAFSQDVIVNDSVNYENEKTLIDSFIYKFATEKDSISLQEYIQFPEFTYTDCLRVRGFRRFNKNNVTDSEIRAAISAIPDESPFIFWQYKYNYNKEFSDSLTKHNISVQEYCYMEEKCRRAMCGDIINRFALTKYCPKYLGNTKIYQTKKLDHSIVEIGCDLYKLGVIKMKGKYKVLYINITKNCE